MQRFLFLALFISALFVVTRLGAEGAGESAALENAEENVEAVQVEEERASAMILHLVQRHPRHKLNEEETRMEFAGHVVAIAKEVDIPTGLIVTVSFLEASLLTNKTGSRGEIGAMQVHPSMAKGCDMTTQFGQLACGAKLLREGFEMCGTWDGALSRYAQRSGRCKPDSEKIGRIVSYRMRFWKKMEKVADAAEKAAEAQAEAQAETSVAEKAAQKEDRDLDSPPNKDKSLASLE